MKPLEKLFVIRWSRRQIEWSDLLGNESRFAVRPSTVPINELMRRMFFHSAHFGKIISNIQQSIFCNNHSSRLTKYLYIFVKRYANVLRWLRCRWKISNWIWGLKNYTYVHHSGRNENSYHVRTLRWKFRHAKCNVTRPPKYSSESKMKRE